MFPQVILPVESSLADWAMMQILSGVQFHVNIVISLVKKLFAACRAHIRLVFG
jgi:hypothetical protein